MKTILKIYTVNESCNIILSDCFNLDVKEDKTVRNLDKLAFSDDTRGCFDLKDDSKSNIKLAQHLEKSFAFLSLVIGNASIFKNYRFNPHKSVNDENNDSSCNRTNINNDSINARDTFLDTLLESSKELLLPQYSDAYKLSTIDFLIFLTKMKIDPKHKIFYKEEFIDNKEIQERIRKDIQGLTDNEYTFILERLEIVRKMLRQFPDTFKELPQDTSIQTYIDVIYVLNGELLDDDKTIIPAPGFMTKILNLVRTR